MLSHIFNDEIYKYYLSECYFLGGFREKEREDTHGEREKKKEW